MSQAFLHLMNCPSIPHRWYQNPRPQDDTPGLHGDSGMVEQAMLGLPMADTVGKTGSRDYRAHWLPNAHPNSLTRQTFTEEWVGCHRHSQGRWKLAQGPWSFRGETPCVILPHILCWAYETKDEEMDAPCCVVLMGLK